MAMAYKCDRCGAFYESNTKIGKITTRRYDNAHAMREYDDLCEKCTWQLQRWFDMGKSECGREHSGARMDGGDDIVLDQ